MKRGERERREREEGRNLVGKYVTFRYTGQKGGSPIFPLICAVREDVQNWDQILHGKRQVQEHQHVWSPRTRNSWTDAKDRKRFFDDFARDRNFDPLVAENWYTTRNSDFQNRKGGYAVLSHYGDSHIKALQSVYPDIGIREYNFSTLPRNYWNVDTKKAYFDSFAKKRGFDPLVPENWYNLREEDIISTMGGDNGCLPLYTCLSSALMDLYPFIGLQLKKFPKMPPGYWLDKRNVKDFFDSFASAKKFDALKPENWYSVSQKDILSEKGGSAIVHSHKSFITALSVAYPNIGLDRQQFGLRGHWTKPENRKKFFDDLAHDKGFNTNDVKAWYSLSYKDIKARKGGNTILNSFPKMLLEAYPDIGLDPVILYKSRKVKPSDLVL